MGLHCVPIGQKVQFVREVGYLPLTAQDRELQCSADAKARLTPPEYQLQARTDLLV